ncbi:MAG: hypothetical protein ABR969_02035 [Sedimentisphaerales bacterium]
MELGINNKTRFEVVGHIQIIAKTLLIICGIQIVLWVTSYSFTMQGILFDRSETAVTISLISYIFAVILVVSSIIFFMILNNDWLVKKILPSEEPIPVEYQKIWFIAALRVGLVFCGLMLLASSIESVIYTVKLIVCWPFWNTQWFSDFMYGNSDVRFQEFRLQQGAHNVFNTILIVYLIMASPGFVKWQAKRMFKV